MAQVCGSDMDPGLLPRQAWYQREMSDGDLTEKTEDREERRRVGWGERKGEEEEGRGGERREFMDPPFGESPGLCCRVPNPKVFSYGIHFIMGSWRARALVSGLCPEQ